MAGPVLLMTFSLALLNVACGGSEKEASAEASRSLKVDVVNISYAPDPVEVAVGTEITWTNLDEGVHHTVTSGLPGDKGVPGLDQEEPPEPDGIFDGDLPGAGDSFVFTFDDAGTYTYFCRIHPSMTGEVIVR
jgi:plastocyanin